MEKYRGRVHWLWDQRLKKQMTRLRIRLLTDLYRDTNFYQGTVRERLKPPAIEFEAILINFCSRCPSPFEILRNTVALKVVFFLFC